jgi:hypothetical protein
MPKFKCTNEECVKHTELDFYPKVTFKYNAETKRLESDQSICPVCGSFREVPSEGITNAWFKAEGDRNYNNKTIKKYDYDREAANRTTAKLSEKGVQE